MSASNCSFATGLGKVCGILLFTCFLTFILTDQPQSWLGHLWLAWLREYVLLSMYQETTALFIMLGMTNWFLSSWEAKKKVCFSGQVLKRRREIAHPCLFLCESASAAGTLYWNAMGVSDGESVHSYVDPAKGYKWGLRSRPCCVCQAMCPGALL